MKIIDARTGLIQEIPFALGEKGRGRLYEEVKTSNRPGQEPTGPEDVSYFTFVQGKRHVVILTKSDTKSGILVRIDTSGIYTRGSCGAVTLKAGKATMLAEGMWAEGDAGRVANGPDQLWHVEGPALFVVTLQGGSSKGMGHRYLIVTKSLQTVMIKRRELCFLILMDENQEVVEVARKYASEIHEEVQAALKTAENFDKIRAADEVDEAKHFISKWGNQLVKRNEGGIRLGTMGVLADLPKHRTLISFTIGTGGGRRCRYEVVTEEGLMRLEEALSERGTSMSILGLAISSDWKISWKNYRDEMVTEYCMADARGVHRYVPGVSLSTEEWEGMMPNTPSENEMRDLFGLAAVVISTATLRDDEVMMIEPEPKAPTGGWTIDDLKAKFSDQE